MRGVLANKLHMDVADVLKLKVPELKSELQKLGLSPKGLKKELQERLTDAIEGSKPQFDISDETATKETKEEGTKGSVAADEDNQQEEPAEAVTSGTADAVEPQNGSDETPRDRRSKSARKKGDEADSASHVASTETEAPEGQPRDMDDQDAGTPEEPVGDGMEEDAEREARDETPMEYDANQEAESMEVDERKEKKEGEEDGEGEAGGEGGEGEESKEKERSRSRSRSYPPSSLRRSRSRSKGRSRSRSKSRSPRRPKSPPVYDEHLVKAGEEAERIIDETFEETERDEAVIVLDSYNSDLHVKVNGTSCTTISKHSLCYLWSGARATHSVTKGKHYFECKLVAKEEVEMPDVEAESHYGVRLGFSVDSRNWVLGESDTSFGYASCGSKVTHGKLETYGESFDVDDVIGCFLDLESEEQTISFSKNGQDHGVAFKLSDTIKGKPLFPHVFTRNVALSVNFGAEEAAFPPPEGYSLLQEAPEDALVRGPAPPANITDTEVVMMVGLPGSGKTSWSHKYCRDNISKKYNILGADDIVQNIRIPVLPSKKSYPHKLTKISHDILARLYEIAEVRKRNYILDQCNYSEAIQSRKMGSFAQSQREAVVIIPKRDELQYRLRKRNRERSRDISRTAIAQMKVDFHLPEEGELFQSVRFVEISGDDAKQMIEDYHSDGRRRLRSPSHDRKRHRHRSPRHSTYKPRPRNYGGGPPRDQYYRRQPPPMDRRPGYFDRPPPPQRMYDRPPRDPPRGPPPGDRYSRARPYDQPRSYPPRLDYGGYQPQSRAVYQGRGGAGGGPGYGGQSRYGSGEPYYGGGGGGSVGYGGPPPPRGGAYSANRGGLGQSYGRGAGGSQMGGRGRGGFDRGYGGYDDRSQGSRGGFGGGRGSRGRGMDSGRGSYGAGGRGGGGYSAGGRGGSGGYGAGGRGSYMGHGGYR